MGCLSSTPQPVIRRVNWVDGDGIAYDFDWQNGELAILIDGEPQGKVTEVTWSTEGSTGTLAGSIRTQDGLSVLIPKRCLASLKDVFDQAGVKHDVPRTLEICRCCNNSGKDFTGMPCSCRYGKRDPKSSSTGFVSQAGAAGMMDGCPGSDPHSGGLALFIIDPQNDFHEGGSLAVSGANADSQRTVELIQAKKMDIERIVVTLDTHHAMHIHGQHFWVSPDGKHPDPFTVISKSDVTSSTWAPRQASMREWALEYVTALEEGGRFPMIIWPAHCLLGTDGHAVHAPLMEILNAWAVDRARSINWYFKGQNNRVEMYSALKAEVEVPDDVTTSLDKDLIKTLSLHDKVVCCGQAMSHCVNWSVRHLLSGWPKGRSADIILLEDAASAVAGFEETASTFISDMQKAGVTVCKVADVISKEIKSKAASKSKAKAKSKGKAKAESKATPFICRVIKPEAETAAESKKKATPQANRSLTGVSSQAGSAGLMHGAAPTDYYVGGIALFIIDPQKDFHEGGSLAVAGATEDSKIIAEVLEAYTDDIERVVVTLDTHHAMHIHNAFFWADSEGKHPENFTIISKKDVEEGKWQARQPELQAWALEYVGKLEAGESGLPMCIWPSHCLLGTPGHSVHDPLMDSLSAWAVGRARTINWYFKGQNNRAEMYSALKAEVEVPDDPTTSLDIELIKILARHNKVICCGEAMSHCVNWSVRHLLSGWPKDRAADIVVLEDGASPVGGFEAVAEKFKEDMRAAGVTVCRSESLPTVLGLQKK